MGTLGVAPNPVLIGSFLRATWNLPLTGQQSLRVYGIGKDFCSSGSGDASVYTALLTFCTRQSMPEKAADVWAVLNKVSGTSMCALSLLAKQQPLTTRQF